MATTPAGRARSTRSTARPSARSASRSPPRRPNGRATRASRSRWFSGPNAVDALLALASEREARLIVVGTYGESPLRSAILGSTPHKLLHLSEVPVLVVPPPD